MASAFCPRCGTQRLGSFRYCRSCQFDFNGEPVAPQPAQASRPTAVAAIPARRRRTPLVAAIALVVLAAIFVGGWLSSQQARVSDIVATATGWSLQRAQMFAATEGFVGSDSPLADGRARWLASRSSDRAVFEAIGGAGGLAEVSLVLPVTAENASPMGALIGRALAVWVPEATDWLSGEIGDVVDGGGDVSKAFPGGTVRVQSLVLSDGSMVTVTITRGL